MEAESNTPTYWLTRFVILRLLGIVYAVAFLVAINQIVPLIGAKWPSSCRYFPETSSCSIRLDRLRFYKAAVCLLALAFRCRAFNRFMGRVYHFIGW